MSTFFSELRSWSLTLQENAAKYRKEASTADARVDSARELDAASAVDSVAKDVGALDASLEALETSVERHPQSLKSLLRAMATLHEANIDAMEGLETQLTRYGYQSTFTDPLPPWQEYCNPNKAPPNQGNAAESSALAQAAAATSLHDQLADIDPGAVEGPGPLGENPVGSTASPADEAGRVEGDARQRVSPETMAYAGRNLLTALVSPNVGNQSPLLAGPGKKGLDALAPQDPDQDQNNGRPQDKENQNRNWRSTPPSLRQAAQGTQAARMAQASPGADVRDLAGNAVTDAVSVSGLGVLAAQASPESSEPPTPTLPTPLRERYRRTSRGSDSVGSLGSLGSVGSVGSGPRRTHRPPRSGPRIGSTPSGLDRDGGGAAGAEVEGSGLSFPQRSETRTGARPQGQGLALGNAGSPAVVGMSGLESLGHLSRAWRASPPKSTALHPATPLHALDMLSPAPYNLHSARGMASGQRSQLQRRDVNQGEEPEEDGAALGEEDEEEDMDDLGNQCDVSQWTPAAAPAPGTETSKAEWHSRAAGTPGSGRDRMAGVNLNHSDFEQESLTPAQTGPRAADVSVTGSLTGSLTGSPVTPDVTVNMMMLLPGLGGLGSLAGSSAQLDEPSSGSMPSTVADFGAEDPSASPASIPPAPPSSTLAGSQTPPSPPLPEEIKLARASYAPEPLTTISPATGTSSSTTPAGNAATWSFPAASPPGTASAPEPAADAMKPAKTPQSKGVSVPTPRRSARLARSRALPLVSEEEFGKQPAYLRYQVKLELLNQAITIINDLPDIRGKEILESELSSALEPTTGSLTHTVLLGLHKLQRVRPDRDRGVIHLGMD